MRHLVWAMAVVIGAPAAPVPGLAAQAAVIAPVPGAFAVRPVTAASPAPHAQRGSVPGTEPRENIPTYDVVLTVRTDGVLHVRETITYDFRDRSEHGIVRRLPYRIGDRLYDIRNVRTSSSTGAPARVRATRVLHELRITVGDEHRKVSGRQAYVIEYDVAGVLTPEPGWTELRWDAIGAGWSVPIGEVSVRVEMPVRPLAVGCRAGGGRRTVPQQDETALTRCGWNRDGPYAVEFTQRGLRPKESVLIDVRLPKGAVEVPAPRYARPHAAFSWPGYTGLAAGLACALLLWLRRRGHRVLLVPHGLLSRWRPGRGTGVALTAAGAVMVVWDLADDIVTGGLWAASVGDPTLLGLGLLALGATIVAGRRPGADGDDARAGTPRRGTGGGDA